VQEVTESLEAGVAHLQVSRGEKSHNRMFTFKPFTIFFMLEDDVVQLSALFQNHTCTPKAGLCAVLGAKAWGTFLASDGTAFTSSSQGFM